MKDGGKRQSEFVIRLLDWGERNLRDFPWRHTKNPYDVFIAECLVQRTKAAQVEPVYMEFLRKWPDIVSLSRATEDEIRSVIRPLGLGYRAARFRTIVAECMRLFGGRIPDNLEELKWLYGKGLGDYMAHAILCFAFGRDVPLVDKNIERILKRVFSIETRKDGHRDRRLWIFAGNLVPKGKAKRYNWSLIDFGALVCTPRKPMCIKCHVMDICDHGRETVCG